MADNSTQGGTDTIRDKDRTGVKTQIQGLDLNIGGGSEVLQTAAALADATANPTIPAWAAMGMLYNGTTWDRMRGDTTNGLDVDVTRLPALPAGTNNIGDVDVLTVPAPLSTTGGGTEAASLRVTLANDSTGVLSVDDNGGSLTVDGTVNIGTAPNIVLGAGSASVGTVLNVGDVDHDAVNTGKVVQTGGHANAVDVPQALVSAAGDRVRSWMDRAGAQVVRRRKLRESYSAAFRIAETTTRLELQPTTVANTTKQLATLHHAASATKEVRLQRAEISVTNFSAATQATFELRRITSAPATPAPAITPAAHNQAAAATECIAGAIPGTGGTDAAPNSPYGGVTLDFGITTTGSTANPVPLTTTIVLWASMVEDDEVLPPIMRAGVLEGYAIVVRSVAAVTFRCTALMRWTEEIV